MRIKREVLLAVAVFLLAVVIFNFYLALTVTGMASGANVSICIVGPPTMDSLSNQTATVDSLFTYQVNCTSNCGENLTFFGSSVDLSTFSINSSTGLINFTPVSGEGGEHLTSVTCGKSGFEDNNASDSFYITVSEVSAVLGPSEINCTLNQDDSNVDLNWTSVSGAIRYTIYYSSNISQIVNLSLDNIGVNVTQVNFTVRNWTDTSAYNVTKRYYTVSATTSGGVGLTEDTVCGKFTYEFDVPVSGTYGKLASNYLSLYLNNNYTAESFMQELPSYLNSTLSILQKSDGNGEFIKTHVRGLSDGNDFNLIETEGYLLTVDNYYNHTIVKDISPEPYNVNYTIFVSSSKGKLATNWKGIYDFNRTHTAETLLQQIPSYLNSTASTLMKTDVSGEFLKTHVRGLSDGNDFDIELGKGYIFTLDNNYTQTLCTRCYD